MRIWVIALVAGLGAALSCSPRPTGSAASAVLITIDTWRADSFGAGGHPEIRTPHLDRFFRTGRQFSEAFAPIPTTLASHASMLTGLWPTEHGIPRNSWYVPDDLVSIAEVFSEHGVSTAAFVSSAALDVSFNLGQGFSTYESRMVREEELETAWRPARLTLSDASRWWSAQSGRRFLWVHLFEPHFPYDPDPQELGPYATGYQGTLDGQMKSIYAIWADASVLEGGGYEHLLSLYHAEIAGLDRTLGHFLRVLDESGAFVIVTSDHGESLGEHGLFFKHGPHVFPGDVRVPLVVRGRGVEPGVRNELVRTIDIASTLLEPLGLSTKMGESANLLSVEPGAPARPVFGVASMPWNLEAPGEYGNARKQRVARTAEWAVVQTPYPSRFVESEVWFDRTADPDEVRPLRTPPGDPRRLEETLDAWIRRARALEPTPIDSTLAKQLESIGYLE